MSLVGWMFQWQSSVDSSGRVYYFRENSSGESSWELPEVITTHMTHVSPEHSKLTEMLSYIQLNKQTVFYNIAICINILCCFDLKAWLKATSILKPSDALLPGHSFELMM